MVAMAGVRFSTHSFRTKLGVLSEPQALFGLISFNNLHIPGVVRVMWGIVSSAFSRSGELLTQKF